MDWGERKKIEKWLQNKESLRQIANKLGRSAGTVSEEIGSNSVNGIYTAQKARHKAYAKRHGAKRDCLKVAMNSELKRYVIKKIKDDQSPEGVSGRIKEVEKGLPCVSAKAIYKFIASPHGRQIEKHLYSKAVKRKPGKKRGLSVSIDGRIMIEKRPKNIEKRKEFGHFEGDFIESGKDGKGSLLVLVERKTRYPFLAYLEDRGTQSVNNTVGQLLVGLPVKSLTIDNDLSFQKHEELSNLLAADIFFCHPHAPHEKGTVENRNKAIRRYVKKKVDLSSLPREYFKTVETKLRNRFMKCLNYLTPREAFEKEILKTKKPPICGILRERLLVN